MSPKKAKSREICVVYAHVAQGLRLHETDMYMAYFFVNYASESMM